MSESGITCRTFCNRRKCYYYKESDKFYTIQAERLFTKILREYQNTNANFIDLVSDRFSNRSYTGVRNVYSEHRKDFKNYCTATAIFLDRFLAKYNPDKLIDHYNYKHKIKGFMDAVIHSKKWNVSFCYKKWEEMQKNLDFYCLNNYIYNQVKGFENDCLVLSIPDEVFYLIKYNVQDYTIKRGYLTSMKINKIRSRGPQCTTCKYDCKPMIINGLHRLEVLK